MRKRASSSFFDRMMRDVGPATADPYADLEEILPTAANGQIWANLDDLNLQAECDDCRRNDGLCARHVPTVCPQLKQPSWHRHAHSGMYRETHNKADQETSPAVRRARRREERKAARKRSRQVSRMVRLIAGEHVRATRPG